jgi:lysozyme
MKLHPRVTRSLVELVKRFEGLRRRAARLPDGGWTIGYGHVRSAREGAVVSPEDAEALLYYDLSEVAERVDAWTFAPLNQNQFEALTAFAFNIGLENFRESTVLKRVNEGQYLLAASAMELWRKAAFGGEEVVVDALVRRRAAEKAHFLTPPEGFRPTPTPVLKPAFDLSLIEAAACVRAGRPAAQLEASLDGEETSVALEDGAPDPLADAAPTPDAELRPLVVVAPAVSTPAAEPPFALQPEAISEDGRAAPDGEPPAEPAVGLDAGLDAGLAVPPPPPTPPLYTGFGAAPAQTWVEPQSLMQTRASQPMETATPLFDAPARPMFSTQTVPDRLLQDPALSSPVEEDAEAARIVRDYPPGPTHGRSFIYISVGLLGLVLFAIALATMAFGKATPVNLIIGLIGILFITPAAGHFLLKALNPQDAAAEI